MRTTNEPTSNAHYVIHLVREICCMTCVAKPDQPDSSALHGRIPPEIMAGMELQTHSLQAGCLNEIDEHFGRLVRSHLPLFEPKTDAPDSLLEVGLLLSSDGILSFKQARALQIH